MATEMAHEKEVAAHVENLFKAKEELHKKRAMLPVEQKVQILIKLQEIITNMRKIRGEPITNKIWKIYETNQKRR